MTQEEEFQASLNEHFLIAVPSLADPNFSQTVTYMCAHTPGGAMGLVINRVHPELTMEAVFKELKLKSVPKADSLPIYLGGPVDPSQVFILHGPPFGWEACSPVNSSVALSNSKDLLESLAKGEGPESFIIALGCAAWSPGQLESEIKENAWLTCPANETVLFETPVEKRWEEAARLMGVNLKLFSEAAGHA